MSLKNFEQVYLAEEKSSIDHNQAFFGQRGRGRNMRGGRGRGHGRRPSHNSFAQGRPNYNNYNNQASNSTAPSKFNNDWKETTKQRNQGKEICQICGRTNHTAITCYYRYDYATEQETTQEALAAINLNSNDDPNFYADSGATAHITNRGNLKSLKSYRGTNHIFVGNG